MYVVLDKNPFYFDKNLVKNNGIVMVHQDYPLSSLKTNDFDGSIMYIIYSFLNFQNDQYKLIKSNPNITEMLVLNNKIFPFNNAAFRKALAAAIYNQFSYKNIQGAHKAFGIIPYGTGGSIDNMPPNSLPDITPQELFKKIPALKNKLYTVTIHESLVIKNDELIKQLTNVMQQYHVHLIMKYYKNYPKLLSLYATHPLARWIHFLNLPKIYNTYCS